MMKRLLWIGAGLLAIIVLGAAYVLRTPETASEPITAVTLASNSEIATTDAGLTTFTISQASSQASFSLGEDLRGVRTEVLGVTDQVAGEIAIDPSNLQATLLGTIQINARTLATDNDFRNRAIQNEILETDSYEYITFTPTDISGLPDSIDLNETVSFTVSGDLTIRDVSQPVTFTVTATLTSESTLEGTATTSITRADFDLTIPSVPQVANVDEEVVLTLTFTANS
ncbi:MAG: YceI family protein [Anaerolineales bacterium]|nr:YceI family protein [Anaerolineales bacterium]MCB0030217.1 YceI family protein [Anaerolineales bacterium]